MIIKYYSLEMSQKKKKKRLIHQNPDFNCLWRTGLTITNNDILTIC